MIQSADKPLTNHSLHGVAGEVNNSVKSTGSIGDVSSHVPPSPTRAKNWFDGVLNTIPKPPLPRQSSHTLLPNLLDEENGDGKLKATSPSDAALCDPVAEMKNAKQFFALQEKIRQQQEEIEKLRQNASMHQRLNAELKNAALCTSDRSLQDKIEELVKEVTFEQTEKFQLLRKITDLNLQVDELDEKLENERSLVDNNDEVDKRLASITRELTETQQELHHAQRNVIRLQKEQEAIGSLYDKKFNEVQLVVNNERDQLQCERESLRLERIKVEEQLRKLKDQESNTAEWQRQLYQKDDIIKQLRSQISDLNTSLETAMEHHEVVRTEAATEGQYLQEEVQDLRVLNDAHEQEIIRLRIELESAENERSNTKEKLRAVKDVQEQEITRLRDELDKSHKERDEIDQKVEELQRALDKFQFALSADENDENCRSTDTIVIESNLAVSKLVACRDRIGAALQDIEAREKESVIVRDQNVRDLEWKLEHSTNTIKTLEVELVESRRVIDNLYVKLKESADSYENKITGLYAKVNGLTSERVGLKKQLSEINTRLKEVIEERDSLKETRPEVITNSDSVSQIQQLQTSLDEMEVKYYKLERSLLEAKLNLAAAEEQKAQLQEEVEMKFSEKHEEKKTDDYNGKSGETTMDTSISSSAVRDCSLLMDEIDRLNAEITVLKQQQQHEDQNSFSLQHKQSRGSFEEELRKELESSRKKESKLNAQLKQFKEDARKETDELHLMIEEREKTISSLVKSAVTLERKLDCAKIEIEILRTRLAKEIGLDNVKLAVGESMSRHELESLRNSLESNKSLEEDLTKEIERLKSELKKTKDVNSIVRQKSLQSENDNDGQNSGPESQVKERDAAISKLVKQSMTQEKLIAELKKEREAAELTIQTLTKNQENSPTWEEVNQLRQEAEVFAGQVIELDEEMEELKSALAEHKKIISSLENQLAETKAHLPGNDSIAQVVERLKAEIDELKEANTELLEELRQLRKKAREVETSAEAVAKAKNETLEARNEATEYQQRVDELLREKTCLLSGLETRTREIHDVEIKLKSEFEDEQRRHRKVLQSLQDDLMQAQSTIQDLKTSPCYIDEIEIDCMKNEIAMLQSSVDKQAQEVLNAHETIQELEGMLAQQKAAEATAHEEEKEELIAEVESLTHQLASAKHQLQEFENDRSLIQEFKGKLERADDDREQTEKALVERYEREISLLTHDKDETIDNLHKKLFEEKQSHNEEVRELTNQLKHYESEITQLQETLDSQTRERDTRIYALERTLEAQEQLLCNMKTEMDQLQGSMETSAARRRQEIDDLQQELVALTSANSKLEREIKSLQVELESKDLSHKDEISKLREIIARYEHQENPEHRTAADLQMELRIKEVKDRLEKLKWRNTSLKEENENLRERLEIAQLNAVENQRQIAQLEELRDTVSKQCEQIDELNAELYRERTARVRAEAATKPSTTLKGTDQDPTPPPQARPPLPPNTTGQSLATTKNEKINEESLSFAQRPNNSEKKVAAASPKRLNFRLIKRN